MVCCFFRFWDQEFLKLLIFVKSETETVMKNKAVGC